jgi:hypothetical protein
MGHRAWIPAAARSLSPHACGHARDVIDLLSNLVAIDSVNRSLVGYAPTPLYELAGLAAELGCGAVAVKDESNRLGLPAFKVLGGSWAVERALREQPGVHTLVAGLSASVRACACLDQPRVEARRTIRQLAS